MTIPPGVFPCVALSGGLGTLAVRQGDPRVPGWLVVYHFPVTAPDAFVELARFGLPAGSPCFPNLYVLDGLLWLAYHDGVQQRIRNMATGDEERFPALSNPSAFGAGFWAYTEPVQPYRVHRLNLRSGEADQPRLGAPTGLSRILDDGRVVTIDEDRHALPGATIPSFAGPLAVGEGPNGGALWRHTSGASGTLYKGRDSFTPKCAADGDTLAITTAGPDVRLFCGTLAQLTREPGIQVNTEESMRLPDGVQSIVEALYLRHTALAHGHDEQRRHLTQLIVEQTVFSFPGQGWGWKSADPNRPPSKDAIAKKDGARLLAFDLFDGGTRKPIQRPDAIDITGQHFIPIIGVNHLGGVKPDPVEPDPVKPPPDPVDLSPFLARLTAVENALRRDNAILLRAVESIEALKAKPDPVAPSYRVVGSTSRNLGHSHSLNVRLEPK